MITDISPLSEPFTEKIREYVAEHGVTYAVAKDNVNRIKIVNGIACYGPDDDLVAVEVGDVLTVAVSNGWEGHSWETVTIETIGPKSLSGYGRKISFAKIESGWTESRTSWGSTPKTVYIERTAAQDRYLREQLAADRAAQQSFADLLAEASKAAQVGKERDLAVKQAPYDAASKAAEIILAKYAEEFAALQVQITQDLTAEVVQAYPTTTGYVVVHTPTGYYNPLAYMFETEAEALDVATRILDEGDPGVRWGKTLYVDVQGPVSL